jgi:hypothetical protein
LRISKIPSGVGEEELRKGLERLSASAGTGTPNILALSLAPHPVSSKAQLIATVTFRCMPLALTESDKVIRLQLGEEGEVTYEVKVDRHFLGLTPLSSPVKEPSAE